MLKLDSALGIEFDGPRLALAVVARQLRDYALSAQLVIDDYPRLGEGELAGMVQRFLRDHSFNRDNVIVGLPREEAVVREVDLPLDVEENLEQVIRFQVERFEPAAEETSCYDYTVLKRDADNEKLRLQIVMIRSQRVQEYLERVRSLGLEPRTVGFGSSGLAALLGAHRDGAPRKTSSLILRARRQGWDLLVCGPAGQNLCEHLPHSGGEVPVEKLLGDMHEALQRRQLESHVFQKLYLVGVEEALAAALRERVDGVETLTVGLNLKAAAGALTPDTVAAAGLAVQGTQRKPADRLNLIPPDQRVIAERATLWPTLVLASLLVLTVGGIATRGYFQQQRLLDQVDGQLNRLQPAVEDVFTLRDAVTSEQQALEELQQLLRGRQVALNVFRDLTERLPDDTYLQQLQLQDTSLSITGFSNSASSLPTLLLDSPLMETVKTDWITQDPRVQGKDRFKFSATVKK